jgi:hypothetical protein
LVVSMKVGGLSRGFTGLCPACGPQPAVRACVIDECRRGHPQGGPSGAERREALDGGGDRRLGAVGGWRLSSGAHVSIAP